MSRLLFAAARGARIHWAEDSHCQLDQRCDVRHMQKAPAYYRIHPDDEHLQYGPIATALRQQANDGNFHKANLPYLIGFYTYRDEYLDVSTASEERKALFLLILVEALADEGL